MKIYLVNIQDNIMWSRLHDHVSIFFHLQLHHGHVQYSNSMGDVFCGQDGIQEQNIVTWFRTTLYHISIRP